MPYEPAKDVSVFKEIIELGDTRVTVGVFSYNEGAKKLQLSRENQTAEGEWRFAKLGRMTKDETEAVLPLMQKAVGQM
ncbi:MAG: hypothetical protein HQL26_08555 [Candidatus Omnitrophica bacterium]|nr:hypothetical protein [Candidatus Omnitrophota bacterium]